MEEKSRVWNWPNQNLGKRLLQIQRANTVLVFETEIFITLGTTLPFWRQGCLRLCQSILSFSPFLPLLLRGERDIGLVVGVTGTKEERGKGGGTYWDSSLNDCLSLFSFLPHPTAAHIARRRKRGSEKRGPGGLSLPPFESVIHGFERSQRIENEQ